MTTEKSPPAEGGAVAPRVPAARVRLPGWGCLWFVLALIAGWHALLAVQVALQGSGKTALAIGQGAVVVHWRRLDNLLGWAVLLLMWLEPLGGVGQLGRKKGESSLAGESASSASGNRLFISAVVVGMVLATVGIARDQWNFSPGWGGGLIERGVMRSDLWLALAGLIVVVRTLLAASKDVTAGRVTLLHLWQLAAVQWVLAWLGAALFLRFALKREDLLGNEAARQLLFAMPMLGVLPNVLMGAGVRWWGALARLRGGEVGQPRTRAWIVALIASNMGGMLLILRPNWLGIAGSAIMIFAIGVYLLGFPGGKAGPWRAAGGDWILGAWLTIVAALGLLLAERIMNLGTPPVTMAFWGGAWRHLLAGGVVVWLFGMGLWAQDATIPERYRAGSRPMTLLAAGLLLAGVALTAGVLLAASLRQGMGQVPVLQWLWPGTVLEGAALVLAGLLAWRGLRLARL